MKTITGMRVGGVVLDVALVLAAASAIVLAQADPHVGTWVVNLEKSTYAPGTAPKSSRSVYSAAGKGIKVVSTTVTAAGATINMEFTAQPDGKDYPVKGQPDYDTTTLTRVDSHTLEFTRKKAGKVVQTARSVVAKDGKTRAITATGVNAQGQKINTTGLWIKQ
jgi:hypothetical protein